MFKPCFYISLVLILPLITNISRICSEEMSARMTFLFRRDPWNVLFWGDSLCKLAEIRQTVSPKQNMSRICSEEMSARMTFVDKIWRNLVRSSLNPMKSNSGKLSFLRVLVNIFSPLLVVDTGSLLRNPWLQTCLGHLSAELGDFLANLPPNCCLSFSVGRRHRKIFQENATWILVSCLQNPQLRNQYVTHPLCELFNMSNWSLGCIASSHDVKRGVDSNEGGSNTMIHFSRVLKHCRTHVIIWWVAESMFRGRRDFWGSIAFMLYKTSKITTNKQNKDKLKTSFLRKLALCIHQMWPQAYYLGGMFW